LYATGHFLSISACLLIIRADVCAYVVFTDSTDIGSEHKIFTYQLGTALCLTALKLDFFQYTSSLCRYGDIQIIILDVDAF
jgi:hypothetical protein